jgi:hypothetical protein
MAQRYESAGLEHSRVPAPAVTLSVALWPDAML